MIEDSVQAHAPDAVTQALSQGNYLIANIPAACEFVLQELERIEAQWGERNAFTSAWDRIWARLRRFR